MSPSPTHLGDGSEGGGPAQLLPAFGHRLGRLFGSLGSFLHALLDLPAKVAFTDFIKTLLRHRDGGVSTAPLGAHTAPPPPRPELRPVQSFKGREQTL